MKRMPLIAGILAFILGAFGIWIVLDRYEGEPPLAYLPEDLSRIGPGSSFRFNASDMKSGLKKIVIELKQKERRDLLFQGEYKRGTRRFEGTVELKGRTADYEDGEARLVMVVLDHSWRRGGNRVQASKTVLIDNRPPELAILSRLNYVNKGGAGLLLYDANEPMARTGLRAGSTFFPSCPLRDGTYAALYAVPYDAKDGFTARLIGEDLVGNLSTIPFSPVVRQRRFRQMEVNITDRFLQRVLPYFNGRYKGLRGEPIERFLRVNREIRSEDARRVKKICSKTAPRHMWEGPFLRLPRSKPMALFADFRRYFYKGKIVDRQVHLGIDLASIARSPVPAGNHGLVVHAGPLGIYGKAVILDHGCGLFSMYGHLSRIEVKVGQMVKKGDTLGLTGQTGLASGDHLHFSILIHGVFVNPIEWWDAHWIRDNIELKMKRSDRNGTS